MRIAIDLDDTIRDTSTNKPTKDAKKVIDSYHDKGIEILVFTANGDDKRFEIIDWLNENEIYFDNLQCGKPLYDLFIDDKAVRYTGWDKDYLSLVSKKIDKSKILDDLSVIKRVSKLNN